MRHSSTLTRAFLLTAHFALCSCEQEAQIKQPKENTNAKMKSETPSQLDTATFAAGCFWCVEAIFERLEGVHAVNSGYAGGHVANPTYKEVCTGATGHAEVAQIHFDPSVISYADLLEAFFSSHDPTTLNRQGNDVGTQYRSAIFTHDDEQKKLAEKYRAELDASKTFSDPIVTEITTLDAFYPAEDYHQNYFNENADQPYCQFVIRPKLDKFTKQFKDKLKKDL